MACKYLVADFFNIALFGDHLISKECEFLDCCRQQWATFDIRTELERKFPNILTQEEKEEPIHAWEKREADLLVIADCLHMKIIRLSSPFTEYLCKTSDFSRVRVLPTDIIELSTKVRHTHNFRICEALNTQRMAQEMLYGKQRRSVMDRVQEEGWITGQHTPYYLYADQANVGDVHQAASRIINSDVRSMKEETNSLIIIDRTQKAQAKRLLNFAREGVSLSEQSSPFSAVSPLIWADVLLDIAMISSFHKAQTSLAMASLICARTRRLKGFTGTLHTVWALILQEHARRCEENGWLEKAEKLKATAAEQIKTVKEYYKAFVNKEHEGKETMNIEGDAGSDMSDGKMK